MPNKPYKQPSQIKVPLRLSVEPSVKVDLETLARIYGCSVSQVANDILKRETGEYSPAWEKKGQAQP